MLKTVILFMLFFVLTVIAPAITADTNNDDPCKPYRQYASATQPENSKATGNIPYGNGILWKILPQDLPDTAASYLFGTMHSQDRRINRLPPQARLALLNSRQLVMEVEADQAANRVFNETMYFQDDKNLKDLVHPDIYTRIATLLPEYGIPEDRITNVKPWAAFTLLGRPRPVRAMTLDQHIRQQALAAGLPVTGIETMQELLADLESLSLKDQVEILNDTVCNRKAILADALELVHLYIDRDLAGIMAMNDQPHHDEAVFNRYIQTLLIGRNRRMLERIQPYLQEGGAFIAVGASHLAGKEGLLNSLAEKGYKIEMIY